MDLKNIFILRNKVFLLSSSMLVGHVLLNLFIVTIFEWIITQRKYTDKKDFV